MNIYCIYFQEFGEDKMELVAWHESPTPEEAQRYLTEVHGFEVKLESIEILEPWLETIDGQQATLTATVKEDK